jgi:hypothetical protein
MVLPSSQVSLPSTVAADRDAHAGGAGDRTGEVLLEGAVGGAAVAAVEVAVVALLGAGAVAVSAGRDHPGVGAVAVAVAVAVARVVRARGGAGG